MSERERGGRHTHTQRRETERDLDRERAKDRQRTSGKENGELLVEFVVCHVWIFPSGHTY